MTFPFRGKRRIPALVLAISFGLVAACAQTAGSGSRTSNVISRADIEAQGLEAEDAYSVVSRLRPTWLRQRGVTSIQDPMSNIPVVYLDGTRWGEPNDLRGIRAENVASIQFLGAGDAQTRFGVGHVGGVILVASRR